MKKPGFKPGSGFGFGGEGTPLPLHPDHGNKERRRWTMKTQELAAAEALALENFVLLSIY
jgi:hypothetical protein